MKEPSLPTNFEAEGIPVSDARENLADILNRVRFLKERFILRRHEKNFVAIVTIEDLALLETIEDHLDIAEALEALKEMSTNQEKSLTLEEVKKRLGLN